jgi:hypothetical protein
VYICLGLVLVAFGSVVGSPLGISGYATTKCPSFAGLLLVPEAGLEPTLPEEDRILVLYAQRHEPTRRHRERQNYAFIRNSVLSKG